MSWQVGLYVAAVFLPLVAFTVQILGIKFLGRLNAYIATGAIAGSFLLSLVGFLAYFGSAEGVFDHHARGGGEAHASAEGEHGGEHASPTKPHKAEPLLWTASVDWVTLGQGLKDVRHPEGLAIPVGVAIDSLAAIMFLMVTFIATLIHIYSMGYMHDDPRYPRFFAYLSLFCFSMLGLVASSSVFMIFMFWELVGVCSYFLIGFWYEDKKNCDAANKAFITNRIGDVGMLMGLGLLWSAFGTFDIHELNSTLRDRAGKLNVVTASKDAQAYDVVRLLDPETDTPLVDDSGRPSQIPYWVLTIAGLGIFAGCAGKSAQFPLHVWLPDAMAGPTPVSALIHAATMVAAGVYLVGRFFPLFTEPALLYIAYTGGITLFVAATIAVVQSDYKKVLAYSTVSQLGFMMLGLGVGGWAAGLFHLITHAFFKALLFLGAGSVYHSVHTYEMPVLGGLFPKMKWTALTMLAATMAISGVPLFSGFYSKDAILASSIHFVFHEGNYQHILLFVLPAVGAAITAFYMFRMWFLVFAGESRSQQAGHGHETHTHGHDHGDPVAHAHESGPMMLWPLFALAVPAIAIGWPMFILPFFGEPILEMMLAYGAPIPLADLGSAHNWAMLASLIIATSGIGLAVLYYLPGYKRFEAAKVAHRFAGINSFLQHKWYFDELYWAVLVRPTLALARGVSRFDKSIVDGVVNTVAGLTVVLSKFEGFFDRFAVDGLVNLTAKIIYVLGDWGRGIQTGKVRNYLMVLACTVLLLFSVVFAWVGRGT